MSSNLKESCPGSSEIRSPFPEEIECLFCGEVNEIWSDDFDKKCDSCGKTIAKDPSSMCIQWCAAARECIGAEKYDRIMKGEK
ncbi:hypothetical protein MCHI_001398 [Candidatus Magnetoovum chiemensis]|nr:hypothetical protein MCHI_001398 [Candidatus Magnetoovum chiemensis]